MSQSRDITQEFTAATSSLPTGELVQDEFFTLAESVGALEIMDPKMDSGCLEPGETLEAEYDFSKPLSASQVLGIMDQLLSLETSWQQGHALAQTVFTSLYIDKLLWPVPRILSEAQFHRDEEITDAGVLVDIVLRTYCCAVVKTCDLILAQVTSEQYFEEEDFSANLYRRELLTRTPTHEIQDLLSTAEAAVECHSGLDAPMKNALLHRLSLRQSLLVALAVQVPTEPEKAIQAWKKCSQLLLKVQKTSDFGRPMPEAFSHKVQRKLASSTPPRPTVQASLQEAFTHLQKMCSDAPEAYSVLECVNGANVLTFLATFMSKEQQPNVYVRCLIQALIFKEGEFLGQMSSQAFMFEDLNQMVLGHSILTDAANEAAEAPQSPRFQIRQAMRTFAEASAHSFADLVRCLCMNRSRTRRMLAHTLNDWENLQFEAEDVDANIRQHTGERPLIDRLGSGEEIWSYPLSSWVYVYKLKQMEWIVQLGFELQVYLPDELSTMYWYLRYLAETRLQHLSRIETFTKRAADILRTPTAAQTSAFGRALKNIDASMSDARAVASFADALCALYSALGSTKLIHQSQKPYGTDDFRHNLRLKPFLTIALPPVPSKDEITNISEMELMSITTKDRGRYGKANALLAVAEEKTKAAKKEWDALTKRPAADMQCLGCETAWRKLTKDVLKSVISTGIVLASLEKAISKAGEGPMEDINVSIPEAQYHGWWLVPVLKAQ